jgi:ABC-type antimicrobial peptide transport system permease subunit
VFHVDASGNEPASARLRDRGSSARSAAAVAPLIKQAVAQIDGRVAVRGAVTLREQVLSTLGPERTAAGFVSAFAALALLVAAVGLYGVVSHRVAQRTKELGVRLALGAPSGAVVWLIVKESLVWVAMGITLGGAGAMLLGRLVGRSTVRRDADDPGSFLLASPSLAASRLSPAWCRPSARCASIRSPPSGRSESSTCPR